MSVVVRTAARGPGNVERSGALSWGVSRGLTRPLLVTVLCGPCRAGLAAEVGDFGSLREPPTCAVSGGSGGPQLTRPGHIRPEELR
jgi:hypothetical protein